MALATQQKTLVTPQVALTPAERGTNNWSIFATETEGVIRARNNVSQRTFEGTISDFNKLNRG